MTPGGVRIGSPALTSRGLAEEDFKMIGQFLHRALEIGLAVQVSQWLHIMTVAFPCTDFTFLGSCNL